MAIQYPDKVADAAGALPGPYNITASNDQFSVSIDGGSNQVFSLTQGSARTATQVVTDLAGLTGATASVANIGSNTVVRIRTTSASENSSTILFNAPANNSNAILGFVATTYKGGTNISSYFTGDTKQHISDGIEAALLSAGWVTVSGSGTTDIKMQSSMTPSAQNLRMRIRILATLTTTGIGISNVFEDQITTMSASVGAFLKEGVGRTFQVIANKHQAAIMIPGNLLSKRDWAMFGTPWIPNFMEQVLYESCWIESTSLNDSSNSIVAQIGKRASFNITSGGWRATITNQNYWQSANNPSDTGDPVLLIWNVMPRASTYYVTRWFDRTSLMYEPLIAWGVNSYVDPGTIRGQLWSAFVSSEEYPFDKQISGIETHTFQNVTYSQTPYSPTLFLRVDT